MQDVVNCSSYKGFEAGMKYDAKGKSKDINWYVGYERGCQFFNERFEEEYKFMATIEKAQDKDGFYASFPDIENVCVYGTNQIETRKRAVVDLKEKLRALIQNGEPIPDSNFRIGEAIELENIVDAYIVQPKDLHF